MSEIKPLPKYLEKYASSEPYPQLTVSEPNTYYANLIMEDYAGIVSEFSAIGQYIYHSFTIDRKEVANLLECISMVEMKHLEILSGLIRRLGCNPIFKGSTASGAKFWNAANIQYGTTMCDKLKLNAKAEYCAIMQYMRHIEIIHDANIKRVLARIVLDEKEHLRLLKQALVRYCR